MKYLKGNKYSKHYLLLMEKRRRDPAPIGEKHHQLPTSIFKNDNVIHLTHREHYIAHLLLTKAVLDEFKPKMYYVLNFMKNKTPKFNSHLFEKLKLRANLHRSELLKGRPRTEQSKQKQREAMLGRPSPKPAGFAVGERNSMFGKNHTNETNELIRQKNRVSCGGSNNPMFGIHRFGEASPNFGRVWINNGVQRKMIRSSDQIPEGWSKGYGRIIL